MARTPGASGGQADPRRRLAGQRGGHRLAQPRLVEVTGQPHLQVHVVGLVRGVEVAAELVHGAEPPSAEQVPARAPGLPAPPPRPDARATWPVSAWPCQRGRSAPSARRPAPRVRMPARARRRGRAGRRPLAAPRTAAQRRPWRRRPARAASRPAGRTSGAGRPTAAAARTGRRAREPRAPRGRRPRRSARLPRAGPARRLPWPSRDGADRTDGAAGTSDGAGHVPDGTARLGSRCRRRPVKDQAAMASSTAMASSDRARKR